MDWFKCTFVYDWLGKRSFAQCGEDLIAQELLKDIKNGTYLEIGAYHPKVFSNTYLFYKKGWKGTVVEPNTKMAELYKWCRRGDMVVEAGILGEVTRCHGVTANYYVFEESARNTFDQKTAEEYLRQRRIGLWPKRSGNKLLRVEKKKTVQLSEVLKKNVDLLSIDTEGLDEEIVDALIKTKIRPKVIIVEGEEAGKIIEKMGYRLAGRTPYSLIYTSPLHPSPYQGEGKRER